MKKSLILALYIVIISILQFIFFKNVTIQVELIGNIITFLSIIFGFYITSLSIFVTSKYVSSLYKVTDKNNKGNTLLHTLFENYKFGLIFTLVSIIYFLIINLSINQSITGIVKLSNLLLIPFFGVIVNNFWYSYKMLSDLINVILQEAKNLK